jgi:hypothetical protein
VIPSLEIPAVAEMARLHQWVCYRAKDKAPLSPQGDRRKGFLADSTDPATWVSFGEAVRMAAMHDPAPADGVGFVFAEDGDLTGIDLDHCGDVRRGEIAPWASSIVQRLPTYTEISLSGRGLHLYLRGKAPRSCQLENKNRPGRPCGGIYPARRYFAMTDRVFGDVEEIREGGPALIELLEEWEHLRGGPGRTNYGAQDRALSPGIPFQKFEALLENETDFRRNWLHKWGSGDLTMSGYDQRLTIIAKKAGWTDDELAGLILEHRTKWGGKLGKPVADDLKKAERRSYLLQTIDNAHQGASDCLRGGASLKQAETRISAREAAETVLEEGTAIQDLKRRLGVPIAKVIITGVERAITYWITLEDGRRVGLGGAADILAQPKVRARLLADTNVVMNSVKQVEWDAVVRILIGVAEREEAADSDPVKELLSVIEEYQHNSEIYPWDHEECEEAFRNGLPVTRDGSFMFTIAKFQAWSHARGHLLDLKAADFRSRLRLADWTGRDIVRRVKGKPTCRYYWTGDVMPRTITDEVGPLHQKTNEDNELA